ncbi:hypothetical protein PVOR_22604 [Paenibacillus vortex V453]|uniref:RNA polymerase subunit sigma n=3 Tax=Paenibacillus TaxID=44249 RepID=A0A163EBG1_9BACL|nr:MULTISPECIES: hypothetical protein [Paenibacillus]ANA83145.1 hypothetical protein A3958_25645 [Paenibacillus glucanolyticus]AVV57765.1 hypothetical protein C7121_17365 [Paenibacillus glucanolyticus]AWP26926.1 hypothetical protein B9D94_09955 [Paenibacillus sp. Cedars]EFU40098.1 hypothetical protein PVOR_22604 [Paenibacillus vortex V453]ETT34541.1 hypothetical protein C169_19324 [Paenibacillus sp. FSL R5-808]
MSLKSVEMQIAVPRTNEAGKIHNEFQQRPMNDQTLLAGEQIKNSRAEAQRSTEVSETAETAVRDDGSRQSPGQQERGSSESGESVEQPAEHPYKGRNFDVSL